MDQLTQLRNLLLEPEQERLHKLEHRLGDPRWQAEEVARMLPDAVRLSGRQDSRLADSLRQPVEECLHDSIRCDTQLFADALFPVMGPAIRKSITETLKGMLRSFNQVLKHSLSWNGLKWRLEARRTGRPFSEVVLLHMLLFQVEEVFLIHQQTGLLLQHVSREGVIERDSDAVSAMLTAIHDFVHDSFATDASDALDTVEVGEHTVWLERGPQAMLACVIRGFPLPELRTTLQSAIEAVHGSFRQELEDFQGDSSVFKQARALLETCLQSQLLTPAEDGRLSPAFKVIIVALVLLLGWWIWWGIARYLDEQRFVAYLTALQASPGIVVIAHERQGGQWLVQGLRDPLAEDPERIAERQGIAPGEVLAKWTPYQDLTPVFLQRRAHRLLDPPPTVKLIMEGRLLHIIGRADPPWINLARQKAALLTGIVGVDMAGLADTHVLLLARLEKRLQPPAGVEWRLDQGTLMLQGEAPLAWIASLEERLTGVEALAGFNTDRLIVAEHQQFQEVRQRIQEAAVLYSEGIIFAPGQTVVLQKLLADIKQLLVISKTLGSSVIIVIRGQTDATGSIEINRRLRLERAQTMKRWLEQAGVAPKYLDAEADSYIPAIRDTPNPQLRRVSFHVQLEEDA